MGKVDHIVDFVNRPYFYQDVSYGSKILFLDNGDRIEMPNVDWYAVCSIIENTLEVVKKEHPQISESYRGSDEAGCYHNNFILSAVRDAGKRIGISATRYDYSEPQYGGDVCDRILCPMKSTIRRYCNEGHDVVSAKDMRAALSERPVRGCNMVFKKFIELESRLDVGGHCQILRNSDTVYDKLRRDWAEKFLRVNDEEIDSAPVKSSDERRHKQEAGSPSSDMLLGWALHKPRGQEAVRFTSEVKQYLTTKFDLGERTGTKAAPGKLAADMRTARNPDGSRMFERKD
ncbi:hypothetical protein AWC38_SpisGene13682 [Stylophora pistillata]|uniref:Uncharacterized protein n=1 Tax=Stylophora pistillata TaxID=50429 RepID=A0A2B4S003_STYPI|nr:hypothetical protein AWC38_SpisGene13682 [Stylophora pistillata]